MPSLALAAGIVASALLAIRPVAGHCKLVRTAAKLSPDGVFDQPQSWGFGVAKDNEFPWFKSQGLDAGADAPYFSKKIEWVENPQYPCGMNEQWGPLNIPAWLAQSEASGVATIGEDGKFETEIFQVNRDGGGECTCEFDTAAKGTNWQKCETLKNPPGIDGMWPVDRVNHTAIFQLPSGTSCGGGMFENKCIVRIRCGWKLRFGGCLALTTASSPAPLALQVVSSGGQTIANPSNGILADSDFKAMAQQVFDAMKAKGMLVNKSAGYAKTHKRKCNEGSSENETPSLMKRADSMPVQVDNHKSTIAANVVLLMKSNNMVLAQ